MATGQEESGCWVFLFRDMVLSVLATSGWPTPMCTLATLIRLSGLLTNTEEEDTEGRDSVGVHRQKGGELRVNMNKILYIHT